MRQGGHLGIKLAAVQNRTAEQLTDEKRAGARVLIVDRDESALIVLKRLLGEASYDTTTVRSGLKALQLLDQGTFDFVLLDDNLPDISGEEVLRQVRSIGAATPVVVMRSVPNSDDVALRYARLGACFFINRRDPKAIAALVHDSFSRSQLLCAHFSLKAKPELGVNSSLGDPVWTHPCSEFALMKFFPDEPARAEWPVEHDGLRSSAFSPRQAYCE
jgi:CheY-like chemotaxis protein